MILTQLGDMHEAIDVVLQLHESAEAGQFGYFAIHQIADLVFLIDRPPWIFAQLFNPKTDSLVDFVDVDNDRFDLVAFLKHLAGMIDFAGPA